MAMNNSVNAVWLEQADSCPNRGFTLIDGLVVTFNVGLLSAVALPFFLSHAARSRVAEGYSIIGAINRAQQAYFLERETFGSLVDLNLDIRDSRNYTYASMPAGYRLSASAITTASPNSDLVGYAGRV